ncbi:MAG: Ig-like domain-containing protein, partial [Verrucomicrobiales bacterium]|nr:Ig-like domain-containing protein [Verrucomicrobiales bacterium]
TVVVRAPALPFNDYFNRAGTLTAPSGTGSGDNSRATRESGEPVHDGKPGSHSLWLKWTAPATGLATFRTDGTGFDSVLAVYVGGSISGLTPVAADDDGGGYYTSLVQFPAQAGVTYRIAIDSYGSDAGQLVLSWNLIANQVLPPKVTQFPLHTTASPGATVNLRVAFESVIPVNVQWYRYNELINGANETVLTIPNLDAADVGQYSVKLDNGEISFFTQPVEVQINTEGSYGALAQNKQADAAIGGLLGSLLSTVGNVVNDVGNLVGNVLGGLLQDVTVVGVPQGSASQRKVGLSGHRVIKNAATTMGYSGTQIFGTYPGKDSGEPNHCGVVGGSSYWLSWQAPASGLMSMHTSGSSYSTILAVYYDNGQHMGYSSLVSVGCSATGSSSSVQFQAISGRVYYIVVDGRYGAYGTAYLNYNLNTPPTISALSSQTIQEDSNTGARSFTVSDRETSTSYLSVSASASNPSLVPSSNITFGGSGSARTVTVKPAANAYGSTTVTVRVSDGANLTSTSFTVTVTAVNDAPVAVSDTGTRYPNKSIQFSITKLLSNDMDPDGDARSLSSNASRSYYGATISRSGNYLIYTPPSGFNSTDSFTYTITDGKGGTATASVSVYVSSSSGTYTVQ